MEKVQIVIIFIRMYVKKKINKKHEQYNLHKHSSHICVPFIGCVNDVCVVINNPFIKRLKAFDNSTSFDEGVMFSMWLGYLCWSFVHHLSFELYSTYAYNVF